MLSYYGIRVLRAAARSLPRPVLEPLATAAGNLAYAALPAKRANAQRNLRIILGERAGQFDRALHLHARRLARRSMVAYGHTLLDFMALPKLMPRVHADTREVAGWEHVEAALASGRGAVFAGPHFGHWDLAGALLADRCPPGRVFAVAEEFADPRVNDLILEQRAAYGIGIVPMDNVREMVRVLRGGHVLGILVDRPVAEGDGVTVRFFGRQTQIPSGAAALAQLARCPILPGYLRRRRDGRFEGCVLPPIEPVRTGNRAQDLSATMQLVVRALEEIIRRAPHQWYMFREMWPQAEGERLARAGAHRGAGALRRRMGATRARRVARPDRSR